MRVDARRLRDKLREYYVSAPHDPVTISVRKGSYTPLFETNAPVAPPLDQSRHPSQRAPADSTVVNAGSWSPDGRSLALDAVVAGNADTTW